MPEAGPGWSPWRPLEGVPALDAEVLRETLEPVLRAGYSVVVVDDGSIDATSEIAERYADVVVVRQSNRGPGAARSAGACVGDSEFVAFIDADDRWLPERLERMVQVLDSSPDRAFVTSDASMVDESGAVLGRYYGRGLHFPPPDRQLAEIARHNFVFTSCLVRRTAYETVGGITADRSLERAEDYDLWLRLLVAGWRGACIDEPLAEYTVSPGSLSRDDPGKSERARLEVLRRAMPALWAAGVDGSPVDHVTLALGAVSRRDLAGGSAHLLAARRSSGCRSMPVVRLVVRALRRRVRRR